MKHLLHGMVTVACVAALALFAGCGDKDGKSGESSAKAGSGNSGSGGSASVSTADLKAAVDKVCACKDQKCLKEAKKGKNEAEEALVAPYKGSKPPQDIIAAIEEQSARNSTCIREVLRGGSNSGKNLDKSKSGVGKSKAIHQGINTKALPKGMATPAMPKGMAAPAMPKGMATPAMPKSMAAPAMPATK